MSCDSVAIVKRYQPGHTEEECVNSETEPMILPIWLLSPPPLIRLLLSMPDCFYQSSAIFFEIEEKEKEMPALIKRNEWKCWIIVKGERNGSCAGVTWTWTRWSRDQHSINARRAESDVSCSIRHQSGTWCRSAPPTFWHLRLERFPRAIGHAHGAPHTTQLICIILCYDSIINWWWAMGFFVILKC